MHMIMNKIIVKENENMSILSKTFYKNLVISTFFTSFKFFDFSLNDFVQYVHLSARMKLDYIYN